ncbi:hypothetical protein D3C80_1191710 [compost metagenome]
MAEVAKQRLVEAVQIVVLRGGHFGQHIRMAADRPLAEDHHGTGQDIGTFYRDGDWRALVGTGQEVGFTQHDAFTAGDIHRINDGLLATVGTMVFHDGRQYRRFFALHQRIGDQRGGGIHHIGVTGNTCQRFFNPFHLTDRDFELAANMGVSAGRQSHRFQTASGVGRQSDTTANRQAFNQHPPTLTCHFWPANDVIDRDEHVVAAGWTILEWHVEREVTVADLYPWGVGWDQRTGDAGGFVIAQQAAWVMQLEGQPQHGGNRCQSDIALVPGQAHAQHLFALPFAHAHGAYVRDGPGVGTCFWAGQCEARNFITARQAWQVVIFLFFSAVMLQQLAWAEGVWHADGDRQNT